MKFFRLITCFLCLSSFVSATSDDIGQRFMLLLPRSNDLKFLDVWLEKTKPAGVILDGWHLSNRKTTKLIVKHLQDKIHELGLPPLFVAVDMEGGVVSRLNEACGFSSVPAPYNLAQAGRSCCFLGGLLIAHQLQSIGINVDFAPSLDLFDEQNYILATRCFSANPERVIDFAGAFAKGLMSYCVMPVVKHFPGLRLGGGDTHLARVHIDFDEAYFKQQSRPFAVLLEQKIPAVMVSHAEYSFFGPGPASQSTEVVDYLMKKNPQALRITDDISMKAFHCRGTLLDDVIASLTAGFHLLICLDMHKKQIKLLDDLRAHFKTKKLDNQEVLVKEINGVKKQYIHQTPMSTIVLDEKELAQKLAQQAVRQHHYSSNLKGKKVLLITVDLPKIRSSERWFITKQPQGIVATLNGLNLSFFENLFSTSQESFLGSLVRKKGYEFVEFVCDPVLKGSVDDINKLVKIFEKQPYDVVFVQTFFYGHGMWNDIQCEWLKALERIGDKLVVFSLGHPYEKSVFSRPVKIYELGSFHKPMIQAAWNRFTREPLKTGADILMRDPVRYLKNKKVALLCNNSSVVVINGKEVFLPDALYQWIQQQSDATQLVALFSPEHGLRGTQEAGASIDSENTSPWECPIFSLHGKTRTPTPEMLEGVDVVVIDLQDVGVRCFTYASTMDSMVRVAADENIPVLLLDRPNPLYTWGTQGPKLKEGYKSFVGQVSCSFLHGKTLGAIGVELSDQLRSEVTKLGGMWAQGAIDDFFITSFTRPSPNLMSYATLFVYPMTVFLEGTNYSEGRGTLYPFQQIGAPWVDADEFAQCMNDEKLSGVYFEAIEFTPQKIAGVADSPKHQGELCKGVFIHIIDRERVKPLVVAQQILEKLFELYPEQSRFTMSGKRYFLDLLVGSDSWRENIETHFLQSK